MRMNGVVMVGGFCVVVRITAPAVGLFHLGTRLRVLAGSCIINATTVQTLIKQFFYLNSYLHVHWLQLIDMEIINNIDKTLKDDFIEEIKSGSKIAIAASCFSIYAFQELKKQLKDIEELRFIFTSPTFITEKANKQKREFYIPRLNRERNLYGSEFEIKLRNELSQKAIAKECAEWIRRKACFKSNRTNENMMGFANIDNKSYMPIAGFTTVELGCERGNNAYTMVNKLDFPMSQQFLALFDQLWNDTSRMQIVTDEVLDNITNAYKENAPDFLYFVTLYNIFNEFLEDISEDVLPNEATGFKSLSLIHI